MYCRKSTDSEDKQIQSIEGQIEELQKIADNKNLSIVKIFKESKTAKKPGRIIFAEMIEMIHQGKADGILCWKLNRLARNPIDGGSIQWMLQGEVIKSIMTPSREYISSDNIIMMSVEFGMANQFILDLSKDVKRGMKTKINKGQFPHKAPVGYLNDKGGEKGNKKIFIDPVNSKIINKMFKYILENNCSTSELVNKANNDWGLRIRATKNKPEKKISINTGYKILRNPFYYGYFNYKGELYKGEHQPIITKEEFDKVQDIIKKSNKKRTQREDRYYNGIVSCGGCGLNITTTEKIKHIKSTNKDKHYTYHHCSKGKCGEKPITNSSLVKQTLAYLDKITIPKEILEYSIKILEENQELEETNNEVILENILKKQKKIGKEINNLISMYISEENQDKSLLSEEEFKIQKNELSDDKLNIEKEVKRITSKEDNTLKLSIDTFNLATYAKYHFITGNDQKKANILRSIGESFILKNRKLLINLLEPLKIIAKGIESTNIQLIEPCLTPINTNKNTSLSKEMSLWGSIAEKVRTYHKNNK